MRLKLDAFSSKVTEDVLKGISEIIMNTRLAETHLMCGEVYTPTRQPAVRSPAATIEHTLPFPFVPATWTTLSRLCGSPTAFRADKDAPSPSSIEGRAACNSPRNLSAEPESEDSPRQNPGRLFQSSIWGLSLLLFFCACGRRTVRLDTEILESKPSSIRAL